MKLTKSNFAIQCLNACLSSCGQGKSIWLNLDGVNKSTSKPIEIIMLRLAISTNFDGTHLSAILILADKFVRHLAFGESYISAGNWSLLIELVETTDNNTSKVKTLPVLFIFLWNINR